MTSETKKYLGKFRGTVVSTFDPLMTGRIEVIVPDVSGLMVSTYAEPCLPFTGRQMGMSVLPQVGTGVWIEYEQGNPDFPIWTGCYYGTAADVPALAQTAPPGVDNVVMQTTGQHTLMISDVPGPTGGILIKSRTGGMIQINETGILISNGQGATIMMNGPTVNINAGALTVI